MSWFNYGYTHSSLNAYTRRRQDSNIDMYDDDMSRLQEIAPDDYMNYRRPVRDDDRERDFTYELDRAGELMERDYYEELGLSPMSRDPDRYGWEQYDRGYYY